MRFQFHPEALDEYEKAAIFYAKRQEGLGFRFVEAVEHAIGSLVERPTAFRVIHEDVRRCLTRVFPYAVLYTIEPTEILLVAVAHCAQRPLYWKGRIG